MREKTARRWASVTAVRDPARLPTSSSFFCTYVQVNYPSALATGLVMCSSPALGDERFARFLDTNPALETTVCAYTTTATSSQYPGETRIDRFSPADGWQLVSINGEPASPQALADYADDAKQRSGDRQQPADQDFSQVARVDSVHVVEEDSATLVFAFSPETRDAPPGGRAMAEKMAGTLTVAKDTFRPLKLVLELQEPASPAPTFKIQTFRQETTFAVEPSTGASLVASMTFSMRGKAFVFRKINNEAHIVFSDYDCRSEPAEEQS